MNDNLDMIITDALRREATIASHHGPGFGDVRRRVRRRRQRNVAAMAVPAVLGVAALGMRTTPHQSGLQPAAGIDSSIEPTVTTVLGTNGLLNATTTTMPTDVIGFVVCLNASGDASNSFVSGCQVTVGGGRSLTAGEVSPDSFVMALDPIAHDDADRIATLLGLEVRPIDASYLPVEIDLASTAADVVVVIGTSLPQSTITGSPTVATVTTTTSAEFQDTPGGNTTTTLQACESSSPPTLAVVVNASNVNDTASWWTNVLRSNVPTVDFADPLQAIAHASASRVVALDPFECNASLLAQLTTGGVEPATAETLQALTAQQLPTGTSIVVVIGDDFLTAVTPGVTTTTGAP